MQSTKDSLHVQFSPHRGTDPVRNAQVELLLRTTLMSALELVKCESGSISLVDETGGIYVKGIDYGIGCQEGETFALDEGVTGEVVRSRDVVILDQYAAVTGGHLAPGDPRWRLAVIGIPITWGERIVGVCVLFGASGQVFTTSDVKLARTVAQIAGAAIASLDSMQSPADGPGNHFREVGRVDVASPGAGRSLTVHAHEGIRQPKVHVSVRNSLIRAGLMRLMESRDLFDLVDSETDPVSGTPPTSCSPDVIIVDLDALSTSAAVSRFQLAHPDSKIVAFCAQPSVTQIRLSIRAGVCGLIDQSSSPARIVEVVAAAARGDWVLDRRSLASLISALDGFNATEREREVLELVERGLGDKQIAALLSISPKTVEKHVHSLLQKSGALNRTMLVRMRSEAPLPL